MTSNNLTERQPHIPIINQKLEIPLRSRLGARKKELGSPIVAKLQAISSPSSNVWCTAKYPEEMYRQINENIFTHVIRCIYTQ